jgi:hypothetical protein
VAFVTGKARPNSSVASLKASRHQFYEQLTSACLPWTEFLLKCHVLVDLRFVELSRAVPLTRQIIPMMNDETKSSSGELPFGYGGAFCDGVMRFRDEWNPAATEFSVDIGGRAFVLSDLCQLVRGLSGHLPKNVLNRLLSEMHNARYMHLKTELAHDPSYSTAADCLLTLINDSRAALQRLDEERFKTPGVKLWDKQGPNGGSE